MSHSNDSECRSTTSTAIADAVLRMAPTTKTFRPIRAPMDEAHLVPTIIASGPPEVTAAVSVASRSKPRCKT